MIENKVVDSTQTSTQAAEVPLDPIGYLVVSRSGVIDEASYVGPSGPGIDATEFIPRQPGVLGLMGLKARKKPIR